MISYLTFSTINEDQQTTVNNLYKSNSLSSASLVLHIINCDEYGKVDILMIINFSDASQCTGNENV